ncbi:hypothetical protein H0H92_012887 [Tricholoma furcatifolium]|nr:hypothetical protein H0H92_012887 [Tricholoma furcatifolium]
MASSASKNAEILKGEGNALFGASKYQAAYDKFSEAIKQDAKNPILWSNRAASALALKKQATTLDPKYAKAWGRQGTAYLAIGSWSESVKTYKKALNCLPSTGELSKTDKVLKTQFEEGLKKAEAMLGRKFTPEHILYPDGSKEAKNLPWKRAMKIEAELISKKRVESSGFVILFAYREFKEAVDAMDEQKLVMVNGQQGLKGKLGILWVVDLGHLAAGPRGAIKRNSS